MRRLLFTACVPLLVLACAHTPPKSEVVWPQPPEKPRIRFVRALSSQAALDTGGFSAVARALTGDRTGLTLRNPMGLVLSDDGHLLFVADGILRRIVVVDLVRNEMGVFAPDQPLGTPFGIALDADGSVYVADSENHEVHVFDKDGNTLRVYGRGDLVRPTGLALDRARRLVYVVDTANQGSDAHGVVVFHADTGQVLRRLGDQDGGGRRGDAPGQFYFPTYLTLDEGSNVYVCDTLNFRIQVFTPDGALVRLIGEAGDGPGTLNKAKGLAFDGFGNLYVVDSGHGVVQLFNRQDQLLLSFGGFAPDLLEYFDSPSAIAIDPRTNHIYVANTAAPRVNVYELINTTAEDSLPPAVAR
ncbi:MAG TPA: SMP-30/gluconolactonase/LRE family protein [Gemmatimonadaceae bacterium]|nr:SMP-30/gluconolactonase/LRE family protein [Gemmatimonadaceae bacterium]